MQSCKQAVWKGYHLSIEGIRKGYLFRAKLYIKGKGLDLETEPPARLIIVEYHGGPTDTCRCPVPGPRSQIFINVSKTTATNQ